MRGWFIVCFVVCGCDEAAREAVRQWQFTPTLLNCERVEVLMTVTVTFDAPH